MKLLVLCLFAAVCRWCVADGSADATRQRRKLEEVLRQLSVVKTRLQKSEKTLGTPSENIQDCCCLAALGCFRDNFKKTFNLADGARRKLYRSLDNTVTKNGLDFCDSRNVRNMSDIGPDALILESGSAQATCPDCHSHPEQKAGDFFNSLESLIQKAINKLMVN